MRPTGLPVAMSLVCVCAAACKQDSVQPGFYDPYAATSLTGQTGGSAAPGVGGMAGTMTSGTGGTATSGASGKGTSGMDGIAGMGSGGADMPAPSGESCDLSGRWISTVHAVTDALGQQQTARYYIYYEIERQGDGYEVTKGLYCGQDAASIGELAVMADFTDAWRPERMKISYTGRPVTSTPNADGCEVKFAKAYTVVGATLPYYLDPKNPMPTAEQQASGSTPGWEDWDNDGQPGITGLLSGPGATGRIFVAPRQWTELSGTVPNTMTSFRLALDWDQEPNVMAYDPDWNVTLGTPSSRHPDNDLHFGEFARLADDQATGDDNAICDAVIELAPMLTPAASAI